MLSNWLKYVIILLISSTTDLSAIEYIGIENENSESVSEAIKKVDYLFKNNFDLAQLNIELSHIKDKKYHDYFHFHIMLASENKKFTTEELNQLSQNGLNIMKISVGLYLESKGNYLEAITAFEKINSEQSQIYLARILLLQDIDPNKGIKILSHLDVNGIDLGNSILGAYYSKIKNYGMANKYLLKVENRNYPSALYNLAINYYYGRGLEKDIVKAKNLFHRVHRLNKSSESALMLGKIALKEKQYEIAINFFLESLNNGNPKGAYELGKYYVENAQIRGNLEKSIRFYNIAIDEGVLPAYYHLAKLKIIQYNVFENEQSKIEAYELADKVSRLDLRIGNETLKMVKDLDKDIIKLKDSGN